MQGITHVRVVNHNDFVIEERFDGVLYAFEPEKSRLVPLEAASLIFGIPLDEDGNIGPVVLNRQHVERRWGWNTVVAKKDEDGPVAFERVKALADERISKIEIEAVSMALREVRQDEPEGLPPPRDGAGSETLESVVQSKSAGKMTIRG